MTCPSCGATTLGTNAFCPKCGASLPSRRSASEEETRRVPYQRDALETGTTFAGRYQIVEELGAGGMGRVYKVIDNEVHAKIALKLIRPEIASDPGAIERFRQELATARAISHKNICRMHDLGRDGSTYYLTMEYVSGQDLKSLIGQTGQLAVGTALSIAKQVCEGLAEAHRLGVIHRDLKPQNIQIDKGGQAKIMDFGIARSSLSKGVTDAGRVVGTPQYMSPEQAEGRDVDLRTDVYALGVILYETLTGRVPFDGDTPLAVAMKHKLEAPRDPRELNPAISPDLDRVILKCLEKDPANRYQSAGDVHADLVKIEQGLPTSEQVVPQPRTTTSKDITVHFTLRRWLVPAVAVVALAAVAFGAWRLWPRKADSAAGAGTAAATSRPLVAVLYFENVSGDPALNTLRMSLAELLITSLSQSRLLNVVSSENLYSILKSRNLAEAQRFSTDDLAKVAKDVNAQYLLTGSVVKVGQRTIITARLQKAGTSDVLRSEKIESSKDEDLLPRLDALANGIKSDLNLSPQPAGSDTSEPLATALTSSAEALKYYTEARRLHLNTKYREAMAMYHRAIESDPGFAMAYRGMAACAGNLGDRTRQTAAATKALELSGRLPERFRYQVQIALYGASRKTLPQTIETAQKLLSLYPDDYLALATLANYLPDTEEWEQAARYGEAALRISRTYLSVRNLAWNYARLGRYTEQRALYEDYLRRGPNLADAHVRLGEVHLILGQFADAQREANAALLMDPMNALAVQDKGDAAVLHGDVAVAEREFSLLLDRPAAADRASGHLRLSFLRLMLGQFEKARAEVRAAATDGTPHGWQGWIDLMAGRPDLAVKFYQQRLSDPAIASDPLSGPGNRSVLGLSYLSTGDLAKAQAMLVELKAVPEGLFVKPKTRSGLMLSGELAVKRGDGRAAVADFERAWALMPAQRSTLSDDHAGVLDWLAQAYVIAGDVTKARETYEKILALTTGRLGGYGAVYARAFYHLGVMAEQQGDKARAREHFTKFLDLWKNADPGQPEVADAKKRMK